MGSSKHKRHDKEKSSKKRHRHDEDDTEKRQKRKRNEVDDDNEDMWVEKNIDVDTNIPPPESSGLKRDSWMLAPTAVSNDLPETPDFFSSLGTEIQSKGKKKEEDRVKEMQKGKALDLTANLTDSEPPPKRPFTPGGPGSQWRMTRLKRVYETAAEEGRDLLNVALERFESAEAWGEALEERRVLDERQGRRGRDERPRGEEGEKGFMFSAPSSRSSSFRRPGGSGPSTPSPSTPATGGPQASNRRLDSLRLPSQTSSPLQQSHTPIPSVMTPQRRALSPSSLNKLQAKVLRAKLMNAPNAQDLEREYDDAQRLANGYDPSSNSNVKIQVLPTLDGRGRLYDVGSGVRGKDEGNEPDHGPGNRKKKEKHFETHDPSTHELVRYNADDDSTSLTEMLRQERFGGGMADQKDQDMVLARAIVGDGKFENDLDYIDDNAAKLGRQKMRSDAMKRQFAIHDYKRTQQALANCDFCFSATSSAHDSDELPPRAPIIAMGTRVYLSCTTHEELLQGHCLIVPIQHCLTMLEGDDDVWDEVKNFMKTLMRMFSEQEPSKGVLFYETVTPGSMKGQRHTYIECVPVEWGVWEALGGYFKESILSSGSEWSTHRKLIDFSARSGGFRRSMVPNLPYFMVQFDYKGEKGYGHVIESEGGGGSKGKNKVGYGLEGDDEEDDVLGMEGTGEKGGGEFPRYFASEIIGNVLEIEPRRWRRPRKILGGIRDKERVREWRGWYDKYDWTGLIGKE